MPQHRLLTALCTAAYFTSYLSRLNLAVVMVELIRCGFAALSRVLPWQGTSLVWAGLAALGAAVSLALAPRWSNFRAEKAH